MSISSFLKLFAGSSADVVKLPHDARFTEVLTAFEALCPNAWQDALDEADANGQLAPDVDGFSCLKGSFRPLDAAAASLAQGRPVVARRFDGEYVAIIRIEGGGGSVQRILTSDDKGTERAYTYPLFVRDFTDLALVRADTGPSGGFAGKRGPLGA